MSWCIKLVALALLIVPSRLMADDTVGTAHHKWKWPSCKASDTCISVIPGEGTVPNSIYPDQRLNIRGTEYIVQGSLLLAANSTNPKCKPDKFAELRRAAVEEAYVALKKKPEAALIKRSMIDIFYVIGTPLKSETNNVGGTVTYYDMGVFSVYINVPVATAYGAEFGKTAGVSDTLECIVDNKRVVNSEPST